MEWAAKLVSRGEITRDELPDGAFGILGISEHAVQTKYY
jgi:hypothetical protein